jgi:N6-adenosine-specific RNA methylase IME4
MTALLVSDAGRLGELEATIAAGLATFLAVGQALLDIRTARLYRVAGYGDFDTYCRQRWGWDRTYAHRLQQAAQVAALLPIGNTPANEAQARELVPLLGAPDALTAVWAELRAAYGDTVTADVIRRAVRSWLGGDARRAAQAARIAAFADPGAFPAGRYSIVYADPPWRYEDPEAPNRRIENHYPTLALDAICAFTDAAGRPVADLAAPDAVLFLWSPVPKLAEAMTVLDAWGFVYRTALFWEKDGLGMGHYVRQRYEALLIGRRGAFPVPAEPDRPDAKIAAPRGRHSEKPAIVYEVIARMYPGVARLELFARARRPGWDAWGNEVPAADGAAAAGGDA